MNEGQGSRVTIQRKPFVMVFLLALLLVTLTAWKENKNALSGAGKDSKEQKQLLKELSQASVNTSKGLFC